MGRKLYVGNIPFTSDENDLQELFSTVGTTETVNMIMDRDTGRPRGFAFVEMSTDAEAEKAIDELNQTEMGGRRLTVSEARPKTNGGDFGAHRSEVR
jgi:RNA recognition motif-containing protein